ncbi:MAG: creatininase family protein [Thermomicrobiales bacterium]
MSQGSAPDQSVFLVDLTAKEVREGEFDTAVLPVAATEYHGDHLPYSADTIMATALAERFARELGTALVLPAIPYGVSLHHVMFPWTLSLRPQTLTQIVFEIGESLLRHGIARLLVVSAHDGNPAPIENAARELADKHGIAVALFSGWQAMARQLLADTGFVVDLDHGGGAEMSVVLYMRPELGHPERAVDLPHQRSGHPVRLFGSFEDVSPRGYTGPPSTGSAEEGAAVLDALAAHVGPFLRELAANGWRNGRWMSGVGRA